MVPWLGSGYRAVSKASEIIASGIGIKEPVANRRSSGSMRSTRSRCNNRRRFRERIAS